MQAGQRASPARHETAHASGSEHPRVEPRDVAHVVVGHELVDQVDPPLVPHGVDEDPDLSLVAFGDVVHRRHDPRAAAAGQGRVPEGFPAAFAACIVAGVPRRTAAALLERERELATCRDGFAQARAGAGTLTLIEGPAGVGKSELARAARAAAEQAGLTALDATGSELEQPFAFGVVRQLLEPALDGASDPFAGAAGPAARLFAREQREDRDDAGFEALHSLYWLIVNLADEAPLLVVVDDCHWADRDSLRFLAFLAQRIEGLPIAMLLAGRPPVDDPGSVWGLMSARAAAVALYPRPLSESAAAALARERLGADAAEEFCRACHTATGGNPLFLRELLNAVDAARIAPSAAAASEVQAVGPAAVRRFVLHRLATLGPDATELARTVAVLGDDTQPGLAAEVTGLGEAAVAAAADDLVRADILVQDARLGFVHPVVRAALYEDLAPGERGARHAAAAEALAHAGGSPERITAHLLLTAATGDRRRIATLRSAAGAAAAGGAPAAAAERLARALAESPTEQECGEILAELGRYDVAAMAFEAAEEHLRAALASGASLPTRADAATTLARCAVVSGGGRAAEAAVAALAALGDEVRPRDPERALELGAALLMVTTAVVPLRPRLAAHLRRFTEAAQDHPRFAAVARIHSAQERVTAGDPSAAAVAETEAALAAGLPPSAATGAALIALQTLRLGGRYDLTMRMLDAGLEGARREGHVTRQGLIHGQRAALALAQGALKDAQVEAETGLRVIDERHFAALQLVAVAIVADVERGALDAAAELVEQGDALGIAEDRMFIGEYLTARGRLRIAQGRTDEGIADLLWCGERLVALDVLWPSDWRAYAAASLAAEGDAEAAARLAGEQLAAARRAGAPRELGLSLRCAAAALGDAERLALLEEAVAVLEGSGAQLELAYALADLGAELGRLRRRREGRDVQRRALQLADECGAVALAERARAELQAGPGRRARIELTGPNSLTAAEWRVCRQAAEGRTNREVAQALFVTEKTVERHLSNAYHKLGIRSRFQLAEAIGA